MRRMRTPLIILILVYFFSVLAMTSVPGTDPDGNPYYMSSLDAAYFIAILEPILRLKDRLAPTTQRLGQANRPNLVDHSASAESGRTSRETDHRPSYATMPPVSSASVRDAANANPMTADWQCIGPEDS